MKHVQVLFLLSWQPATCSSKDRSCETYADLKARISHTIVLIEMQTSQSSTPHVLIVVFLTEDDFQNCGRDDGSRLGPIVRFHSARKKLKNSTAHAIFERLCGSLFNDTDSSLGLGAESAA